MGGSESTGSDTAQDGPAAKPWAGWRVVRVLAGLVAFAWAAFWMTMLRTMGYGWFPALHDLGSNLAGVVHVLGLYVLPVVLVLAFRRRPRAWRRSVSRLCVTSVLFAIAWAGVEEALWRSRAPGLAADSTAAGARWADPGPFPIVPDASAATVFTRRWWPFQTHALFYDPATGTFGGYD